MTESTIKLKGNWLIEEISGLSITISPVGTKSSFTVTGNWLIEKVSALSLSLSPVIETTKECKDE